MIVVTAVKRTSWVLKDAKVQVLNANYKSHRLDVCAEAAIGDFQNIDWLHAHRIEEVLLKNGIGALYYMFNIISDRFLHFFAYNPKTNTCETRGKVEVDARNVATHWHDGVFLIVENHDEQPKFRVRRYHPAIDKIESVSVENIAVEVRFKVYCEHIKAKCLGPLHHRHDRF